MTEAERQTVIDALEEGLGCLSLVESDRCVSQNECEKEYALIEGALAIMRREREPAAWIGPHGTMSIEVYEQWRRIEGDNAAEYEPLYKD